MTGRRGGDLNAIVGMRWNKLVNSKGRCNDTGKLIGNNYRP